MHSIYEPIRVHKALDAEVNIGPIPGSQIWWWSGAMLITIILCNILGKGWPVGFPLFVWMAGTSWILTGNQSWKFLNRFHKPRRYVFAQLPYSPLLQFSSHANKSKKQKGKASRR
ncbi:MAG: hypothetical protein HLUCCA11_18995 [Phormidesmis priestleyi Ana]|uniref:Uncharacterized protein n=1 Tax=Phormidesmis priestleyi Ana TaxID=1666911 RepID=A0A0N8KMC1_9CYAN|nr:MAG: hypothetical protein HLUCCA11_18995 [Phormidesmis priestleyi Ana]